MLILIVSSLNQHLMQLLSYTQSRYLTNTPTRFVLPEEGVEMRQSIRQTQ
jgi:hypothetical protein